MSQVLSTPGEWVSGPFIRSVFTTTKPGRVNNCNYVPFEVFRRGVTLILCVATAPFTCGLWVAGKIVGKIGDCLKTNSYTYIQGNLSKEIEPSSNFSIFCKNVCSFFGGFPWLDGLPPARERVDAIVRNIQRTKPQVVTLQEVSFSEGKRLAHLLKDDYAHIFTRIGHPDFTTMESCLFFATNFPVLQAFFVPFPGEKGIRRGYFCVEFEHSWVISTHLVAGRDPEDIKKRSEEFAQIHRAIENIGSEKPIFLAGDMNVVTDKEYLESDLNLYYFDPRNEGDRPEDISEETATCTNQFQAYARGKENQLKEDEKLEIADYIVLKLPCLIKQRFPELKIEKVPGFKNPARPDETTLSDHHGLLCHITLQ